MAPPTVPYLKRLLSAMLRHATSNQLERIPRSALTWLVRPNRPAADLVEMLTSAGVEEHTDVPPAGHRGYPMRYFLTVDVVKALDVHFPPESIEAQDSPLKRFLSGVE